MSPLSLRSPDHLGDAVMALPAVLALAARFPIEIHAPRWGADLFAGLPVVPTDAAPRHPTGVLFKPSFGAAWRWRHLPQRIGLATNGRSWLLSQAVPVPEGHRRLGYAAVAGALGVQVVGLPLYASRGKSAAVDTGFVGLNPWSPTATVRWPWYRELATRLRERGKSVVFFCGPGEEAALREMTEGFVLLGGLSLPDFAATLEKCSLFISNDSGAAHFAAACGVRVRMLHGSTAPEITGVGEAVEGPRRWCQPCYRKRCPFGVACLRGVGVEMVEET